MDFTKKKEQKLTKIEENQDDTYVKEMKSRLLIKKQKGVIGEENLGKFYIEDEEDTDRQIRFRIEFSANFWSVLMIGAFVSRLIYPSSIRFVKNRLKLEGFLNTHMAILPFIFMSNAVVLGIYEGFWGKYWFMNEIEQKRSQITKL